MRSPIVPTDRSILSTQESKSLLDARTRARKAGKITSVDGYERCSYVLTPRMRKLARWSVLESAIRTLSRELEHGLEPFDRRRLARATALLEDLSTIKEVKR